MVNAMLNGKFKAINSQHGINLILTSKRILFLGLLLPSYRSLGTLLKCTLKSHQYNCMLLEFNNIYHILDLNTEHKDS